LPGIVIALKLEPKLMIWNLLSGGRLLTKYSIAYFASRILAPLMEPLLSMRKTHRKSAAFIKTVDSGSSSSQI
jgi:hypothetical protein